MATASVSTKTAGLLTAAKTLIQGHEGRELKVYRDTLGIPTIGIGFNLTDPDAQQLCSACGADYEALVTGADALTDAQCDYLYEQMAIDTLEWLTAIFPAFFTYTQNRQMALLDMGYNLGETRFREFREMISAILAGDWARSGEEALRSVWSRQVGERAITDAALLSEG